MQYRYCCGDEDMSFDLIPEPQSVTLKGEAADSDDAGAPVPVALPLVGRISEDRDIDDIAGVFPTQLADDIEAATGLRWDIASDVMVAGLPAPNAATAHPVPPHASCWKSFITLRLDPSSLEPQEYRLTIARSGIDVVGGDTEGVRNGVQTLRQIIRQCAPALPRLVIADKPAYKVRGYYLDATRGRVPTLDWLKTWADRLCLYKYNQLQLYIEHTFMFDDLSETWRGTSPLKPADIIAFDEYCARLGIELVPSVSTFGHQYMAMRTRELRHLGEFPEDADRRYGFVERQRHHTLNITEPESLAFSFKLIDAYMQLFRTRKFNICGDETFDLGRGRSKPEAERRGVAAMYADFVSQLCRHLSERGREPMFWGDIAVEMPQILGLLPDNVTLLNWLYAPGIGEDKVRLVAQAGAPQYVCSAVWCWNALLPRLDDSWNNISRLARYGVKYGAVGYLVTDWGDYGHVNDPRMAVSGMIFGAQCAWNPMAHIQGEAGCGDGEEGSAAGYAGAAADAVRENKAAADGDSPAPLPSSSEGDDYTGGAADAIAGAPAGGDGSCAEMCRRVAEVEYGDRSGGIVEALRDAACRVAFGWDDMVWYCELDEGDGRMNRDAASAIHLGVHGFSGEYGREWDARLLGSTDLDEARRTMLQGLSPHIVRAAEANEALLCDAMRLGAAAGRASRLGAARRDVPAMLAAIEGQRWFNLVGLCLARRHDVITVDAGDIARASAGLIEPDAGSSAGPEAVQDVSIRVARGLERWFETYCDLWRSVSAESELARIASIVWHCADALRS